MYSYKLAVYVVQNLYFVNAAKSRRMCIFCNGWYPKSQPAWNICGSGAGTGVDAISKRTIEEHSHARIQTFSFGVDSFRAVWASVSGLFYI
jgi:hypothetical protein